jgi:signal transduction histidine kinase
MPAYFDLRFRLTALMATVLCVTVAISYELNRRAERQIFAQVEAQTEELTTALEIGMQSISRDDYLDDFIHEYRPAAESGQRIRHILITDAAGVITDSSLREVRGHRIALPPADRLVTNGDPLANPDDPTGLAATARTIVIPFQSAGKDGSKQKNYVVVVMSSQTLQETILRTSRNRLLATGVALVLSLAVAVGLVWRFTSPLNRLAQATRRVATGDLTFQLNLNRKDEIGQLAARFDVMIEQLREKKELETRLNQAERAAVIGRLASGVAHEIRNPLNFINLTMDHVRKRFAPPDAAGREVFERLIGSVKDEIARLNSLVTNVLRFGRPAQVTPRKISLAACVRGIFHIVQAQADDQNVFLHCIDESDGAEVEADAELLKSCFSNLAINAIQAMPQGGTLTFTVRRADGRQIVTVRDTGVGIPADKLDRVFDPYYSTKETGIGLGLAVTQKIIEEHGGEIAVASVPGEGTTFSVTLPETRMN